MLSGTQRGAGPRFGTPAASTCSNHNSTWTPPIIFILSYKQVSDQCLTSRARSTLTHCVCVCVIGFFHPSSPPHGVVRLYRYMLVGCCCTTQDLSRVRVSLIAARGGASRIFHLITCNASVCCVYEYVCLAVRRCKRGRIYVCSFCELKSN